MRNIELTIEYDGKRYSGWQRLGDDDRTIQGKTERVLHWMTNEGIEVIGLERTNAGTYTRGQVANFKTNTGIELSGMTNFMNRYLPRDIVIKRVEEIPECFHARYNAVGKKYSYYVWNNITPSTFGRNRGFYFPQELDMDKLNVTYEKLMGAHDFIGFSALGKLKKPAVHTIDELPIEREGEILHFTFAGGGLLYKMVWIIMGTLLEIGTSAMPIETIDGIFGNKVQQHTGETVPVQGLFLDEAYCRS